MKLLKCSAFFRREDFTEDIKIKVFINPNFVQSFYRNHQGKTVINAGTPFIVEDSIEIIEHKMNEYFKSLEPCKKP